MVTSGEVYLMRHHPVYKRRYSVSTDIHIGCRIGCLFCYYRWGPFGDHFRPGAALIPLCTPAEYWRILRDSKLVRPNDIVIFCARSDFSMAENRRAFFEFLDSHYDPSAKPLHFLVLQRAPWSREDWKRLKDAPVIFGTTITPKASEKGFNRVRDDDQIRGLLSLREAGCPKKRISLELGPILPDTVESAIAIAEELYRLDIIEFLTYRGSSIGQYGDFSASHEELKTKGFWQEAIPYTYFDGKQDRPHEYYLLKNHIPAETEGRFLKGVQESTGLRVYRHTGHLYAREFGIRVAITRNNRLREDMRVYARPMGLEEVSRRLREEFGIDCPVSRIADDLYLLHFRGTEDLAHAIGAELGVGVLFSDFSNQPTMEDVRRYFEMGFLL